jgi:hypothetical protein
VSCTQCRSRKAKCDRKLPCQSCVRHGDGVLCSYGDYATAQRQAREFVELRERIQSLERTVQGLRPGSLSVVGSVVGSVGLPSPPDTDEPVGVTERPGNSPNASLEKDADGNLMYDNKSGWDSVLSELGELKSSLRQTYAKPELSETPPPSIGLSEKKSSGFPFYTPGAVGEASELLLALPPKDFVDYLVGRYLVVFASLLHVLHEPTFMEEYGRFWEAPVESSLSWLAILYVVMGLAILSLDEDDARLQGSLHVFAGRGLGLVDHLRRYNDLTMRCLVQDRFMERYRLHTIQALTLLIYSKNLTGNSSTGWALLGESSRGNPSLYRNIN